MKLVAIIVSFVQMFLTLSFSFILVFRVGIVEHYFILFCLVISVNLNE